MRPPPQLTWSPHKILIGSFPANPLGTNTFASWYWPAAVISIASSVFVNNGLDLVKIRQEHYQSVRYLPVTLFMSRCALILKFVTIVSLHVPSFKGADQLSINQHLPLKPALFFNCKTQIFEYSQRLWSDTDPKKNVWFGIKFSCAISIRYRRKIAKSHNF